MGLSEHGRRDIEELAKYAQDPPPGLGGYRGTQFIIETDDVNLAQATACEFSKRVNPSHPVPVYVLCGEDYEGHTALFSREQRELSGELVPRDVRVVLLIENFDQMPVGYHRGYSHLVDGENAEDQLAPGSLLLLHVSSHAQGKIELGAADRGLWVKLDGWAERGQEPSRSATQ